MRDSATRLAHERAKRGITQRDFAALLGLKPPTLSPVENGHRQAWPKLRADAARLLGIDEDELFPPAERRLRHGAMSENSP